MAPVIESVISPQRPSVSVSASASDSGYDVDAVFSEIWREVIAFGAPKPVRKLQAFKHFAASVHNDLDRLDVEAAIANYRVSERVKRGFIMDASTFFLNWRDWIAYVETGKTHVIEQMTPVIEPSREEIFRSWVHDVHEFVALRGEPCLNDGMRSEQFDHQFTWLARGPDGSRWSHWLELCAEFGVSPVPEQVSA